MLGKVGLPAVLLVIVALIGGCTVSTEDQAKTVTAPAPPARSHVAHTTSHKRAPAPAPQKAAAPEFTRCDANIEVKANTTTCAFAQNVFWHYWTSGQSESIDVYSPATGTSLATSCTTGAAQIVCRTNDNGVVRFPQGAVDRYSTAQADHYASTHDLGPDPEGQAPSDSSAAQPTRGDNIPNYENGQGSRVQCADGMYSHSGGIQGACSGHGGVR